MCTINIIPRLAKYDTYIRWRYSWPYIGFCFYRDFNWLFLHWTCQWVDLLKKHAIYQNLKLENVNMFSLWQLHFSCQGYSYKTTTSRHALFKDTSPRIPNTRFIKFWLATGHVYQRHPTNLSNRDHWIVHPTP